MDIQNQDISIETPQTLREVGIHLGTLSANIKELKDLQIKQHAENIARMNAIAENSPTRNEFADHEERIRSNTSDLQIVKTQLKTWGVSITFIMTAIQLVFYFFK